MAKPRVAAGALFFDANGRVLLVKPNYKQGWDIPGGYVEPGETPLEACKREICEELGFRPSISRLLVVDWAPSDAEGDKLLFVFDGGVLAAGHVDTLRIVDGELSAWAFKDSYELVASLPPRLQRRIEQSIEAWRTRSPRYLEQGVEPIGLTAERNLWWTTDDVASYLGVTASTVRAYLARQQMPEPDLRAGQQRLWRPETIERWQTQRPHK